jgi:hypothetical protein
MASVKLFLDKSKDTAKKEYPPKSAVGGYEFSLNGYPSQVIPIEPFEATFLDVPSGDYVGSTQAIDANGNLLESPATISVNVPEPNVWLDIPVSLSALVATVTP